MESPREPLRKIPTKHVPDVKVDVGTSLKEARSKKGHSIDAVSQHTRIPRKFLDALENNRFEEFPALAYLRGFLKSYCDYLEVDFDALWRRIEAAPAPEAGEAAAGKPAAPAEAPAAPAAAPKAHASAHPASAPAPRAAKANGHPAHGAPAGSSESSLWLPGLLILAGCVLAGIGLYWLSARDTLKPAPPEPPAATTPAVLAPLKPAAETQLTLEFRREMWVSVSVDGVEKFQGRVPQNTKQDWTAQKDVVLRASDPQALSALLNGKPYALPAPQPDGTFRIEAP